MKHLVFVLCGVLFTFLLVACSSTPEKTIVSQKIPQNKPYPQNMPYYVASPSQYHTDPDIQLRQAIYLKDVVGVNDALNKGADPDLDLTKKQSNYSTGYDYPLYATIRQEPCNRGGCLEIARLLLEAGARQWYWKDTICDKFRVQQGKNDELSGYLNQFGYCRDFKPLTLEDCLPDKKAWRKPLFCEKAVSRLSEKTRNEFNIASDWFYKAVILGDAEGQFQVGGLYYAGEGVKKDKVKSFEWYKKAALQGHIGAQYALGMMYESGLGVEQNKDKAAIWYLKVCNSGSASDAWGCAAYKLLNNQPVFN